MSDNWSFAEKLAEIDWAFRNLSNEGVHSIHWYPATFLSAVPGTLIPILSKEGETVLDPFCGTATTGVEAIRLNRRFIGIDTNPIATLIGHAKLFVPDPSSFLESLEIDDLRFQFARWNSAKASHPQEELLVKWYERNTYLEILFLLYKISALEHSATRRCAQAILSSILKNTSSQSRHWGWVCDNVAPKRNEIQYKDAIATFQLAAQEYAHSTDRLVMDLRHRRKDSTRAAIRESWKINWGDCIETMSSIESRSIGLVLTSPPYYGVADYVKSQRLSLLWFDHPQLRIHGLTFGDFDRVRGREAGSRQFRHRNNSFEMYVDYMKKFFEQSRRVLKRGGHLALVVGESKARTPTLETLVSSAREADLQLVYQSTREIKDTRRRLMAKVQGEDIIILKA
jgi:adenine-specific DNA methylase